MIVTCPGCSSNYRVRNESVPEGGAKMRCPKCQTMFLAVAPPGSEGPPSSEPPPSSSTPEPISGIYDLSTLRAPTPGDQIPFASTRPSGAMPKLEPQGLSSFPPTKIPPAVFPSPFGSPSSPPQGAPGFPSPPSSNPFLSGAPPTGVPAPWTSPHTQPAQHATPSTAPRAPHPASSMSLPDLAAQMQGRTPSLQPPYVPPPGPVGSSSVGGPFSPPPPTSPFSGGFNPPSPPSPFGIAPPMTNGSVPTAPLPPRHPQGAPQRTSSLVGVLGADLFPSRGFDGPTLPSEPPRSAPITSPLRSDAPTTSVDPFLAVATPATPRSTSGVQRATLVDEARREAPIRTGEFKAPPRTSPSSSAERSSRAGSSPALSFVSWIVLSFAVLLAMSGGLFSGWAAGIVDLDAALLPALETRFGIAPPRSFIGRDDVTVDALLRDADAARGRADLVGEGVALARARAIAPLDDEIQRRMTRVLGELGAPSRSR